MEERRTRSINWPEGGGQKERKGGFGPCLILSAARCVQIFSTGNLKTFKYFLLPPWFRFVADIGITWQSNQRGYPEGFLSCPHNMHSEWLC